MDKRNYAIDVIRAVSIYGVILIHSTSRSLEMAGLDILRLPQTLFLNQSARFAVPLFFFISGFLLGFHYFKDVKIVSFYKKRLSKLIIPFVAWSFIYYFVLEGNEIKDILTFSFWKSLIGGSTAIHLYFIPSIFIFYLIFPLILHFKEKILSNFGLVILTLAEFILLIWDYSNSQLSLFTPLRIAILNILVFILGIKTSYKQDTIKKFLQQRFIFLIFLGISSLVLALFESGKFFLGTNNSQYLTSQWRISIAIYSLCVGGLIYLLAERLNRFHKIISSISRVSLLIFFSHVLFISLFWKIIGSYLFSKTMGKVLDQFWFEPLVFLFVAISATIFALIIKRIPVINVILGGKNS